MGAGANEEWNVLIDLNHLNVVPKAVRPLEKQLPDESRKLWEKVTNKLIGKEFGEANKYKQGIEQRQRDEAAERKKKGIECVFFYSFSVPFPRILASFPSYLTLPMWLLTFLACGV